MKPVILLACVLFAICLQLCTAVPYYGTGYQWQRLPSVPQSTQERNYYFPSNEAGRHTQLSKSFSGPNFFQNIGTSEIRLETLALHNGPDIGNSVHLNCLEEGLVVDWEYITPQPTGSLMAHQPYGKAQATLSFVHRLPDSGNGTAGIDKVYVILSVRPDQEALVLNSAAPWDAWPIDREECPEGFPVVPGQRMAVRVEVLSDHFRISVLFGSQFTYDYMFCPEISLVFDGNEIYVA